MTPVPQRAQRLYRALLRAYPRELREDVGEEMLAMFCERWRDERARRGARGLASLWARTFLDVARNAPAEHLARLYRPRPDQGGFSMDALVQDLRYAARALVRRPAFLVAAVVTLALGVGANASIYGMVHAVLLRSLPFPEPDQLVVVSETAPQAQTLSASWPELVDWRDGNRTFSSLAGWRGQSVNMTGDGDPERVSGAFVTHDFLAILGAQPLLGRGFTAAETDPAGAQPVAILSYGLWQRSFGADPRILARQLTLNGRSHAVVGVMGPEISAERGPANAFFMASDLWLPLPYFPNAKGLQRGQNEIMVVGRMKPGVGLDAAGADLALIARRLETQYPDTQRGRGVKLTPVREALVGESRAPLLILFGAVGLVLLIACVNVANLLLARASHREKELAVRAALGAGRPRLIRQLLTESLLIGLLGGGAGLLASVWLQKGLVALVPAGLALPDDLGIDRPVFLYTLAVSLATGLLFGVFPALKASRPDVNGVLKGAPAGLRPGRFRDGLVVVEASLSLILLVGAGLLLRSAAQRAAVDPGFRTDHLLTAQFRLPPSKYREPAQIATFFRELGDRLEATPGVEAAALVRATPFGGNPEGREIYAAGGQPAAAPGQEPFTNTNIVSPGYFRAMGIPLLAGRALTRDDGPTAPKVAVVNAFLAAHAFPGQDPLGKRLRLTDSGEVNIVGVAADSRHRTLIDPPRPLVYLAHEQNPKIFTEVVVRTAGDPRAFMPSLRAAIWSIDKDQPVWGLRSMDQLLENQRKPARALGLLVAMFAAVAVLLAGVGLYGVMSYAVSVRTREIGIRMALGASGARVVRQVVARGMALAAAAVVVGLAGALALGRVLVSLLFGVAPSDPLTLCSAAAILLAVSLIAAWLPARRAARVAPSIALAQE